MTEAEIVQVMYTHFAGLFPKTCGNCRRTYSSLGEYVRHTKKLGPAISYDVELQSWKPETPLGTMALSQCGCGTTLGLSTNGTSLSHIHGILTWIKTETEGRGTTAAELIDSVREEVRRRALAELPATPPPA